MPAIDMPHLTSLDEQLLSIIIAAPTMPLNNAGTVKETSRALQEYMKGKPALSDHRLAGLWLLAGDLERSHTVSQRMESADGSYWHGIMHRREGDYFNAKYWMRRTSGHPVTDELKRRAPEYVDAMSFVDYVEKAMTKDPTLSDTARRIQWLEWQLLFGLGSS